MSDTDDPFKIRAHVADFEAISAAYAAASEQVRQTIRHHADIAYGSGAAERLDLFLPADAGGAGGRPVHIFVHGGYWRANRKEDYAFVAAPVVAAGAIAAIVEYPLMPGARMGALVDAVRRVASWVLAHAAEFGGDPAQISASGHSAGAHLAFYLAAQGPEEARPPRSILRSVLLVSGIYDLAPIPHSFLQPEIALTAAEVAAWSPLTATPQPGVAVSIAVGGGETAPFLHQAARLGERLASPPVVVGSLDHMRIQRDLGTPGTEAAALLQATVAASHPTGQA